MQANKSFRLFLSSTFSDLVIERDNLQKKVFPKLRRYCEERGFIFQVVDLRWGVSERDGWDHRTLDICLDQVKYCKDFLKPHFAIMLSERYGWIPLPNRIIRSEFEIIYSHFTEQSTRELFNKWYRLDKNTDYYYLQTLTEATSDEWKLAESELLKAFQAVVKLPEVKNELGAQKAEIYFQSATEQEIIEGLFNNQEVAVTNIHTFYRRLFDSETIDFTGLTSAVIDNLSRYCDLIDGKLDNDKHDKCSALIEQIADKYQKANLSQNMHKYDDLIIKDGDYSEIAAKIDKHEEYLTKFCDDFEKSIQAAIDQEIKNSRQQVNDSEEDIQAKFLTARTDNKSVFAERVREMNIIENYIQSDESRHPLVLIGESGSGKSSLMAQAIKRQEEQSDMCVLYRFVGISEQSSTDYQLVRSLNNQIKQYIQQNNPELKLQFGKLKSESTLEKNYDGLCEIFIKRVEALSEFKKVVIFIDAVDQLILESSLEFIPLICNKNLKFIVSTLPEIDAKYVKLFKLRIMKEKQEQYLVRIALLNRKQMTDAFDQFNKINQIIQKTTAQKEFILHSRGKAPLNFKIMLESSKAWRSYDEFELPQELNSFKSDVTIGYFFESLPHEAQLIQLTVGLLSASREGLIENDLLDMLSQQLNADGELYNKVINDIYKNKPERIPDSVWLRINADLSPYLTHKSLNGVLKLALFHRRFNQVALQYAEQNKVQVRDILIDYYQAIINQPLKLDNQQQHLNAYRELSYQYSQAGKFEQAFDLLMKQDFIYLLAKTDDVAQLIGEYHYVYRAYTKIKQRATLIRQNSEFVEPLNYVPFRSFYSWLFNAESVIENRNKIMPLWVALSQLGRDNDLAIILAQTDKQVYYCEQEPKRTMRYEQVFTRIEDISHIVGVFNLALKINQIMGSDVTFSVAHMLVITQTGYVYIKPASQRNFMLINDSLGKINGALQDVNENKILVWDDDQLISCSIATENPTQKNQEYRLDSVKFCEQENIRQVINHAQYYILLDDKYSVQLWDKEGKKLESANYAVASKHQFLYAKSVYLAQQGINALLNNCKVAELDQISQWYQSPHAADLILGWNGKEIYSLNIKDYSLIKPLYTAHKSTISAIFGLRNYRYLSLAQDGELHYWNSLGESLGIFKSNYFHDILGVTEFSDNLIVILNQRGYAVQIDLDLIITADLIKNSPSVITSTLNEMATKYEVNHADNDNTLNKYFKTWCEVEKFTSDVTSCHSIDQEEFSFIDTRNNQVVFVTSCQILGITRYVINNIWLSMGKINQVISNDETQAELLVNAEYVQVIKQLSRKIVQSPISQIIYTTTTPVELANKPEFIELLQKSDLNQQDEFGFTPLFYALNSNSLELMALLVRHGAQLDVKLYSGATPLLIVSQDGNLAMLKWLITQGADIQLKTNDGWTALMAASQKGHGAVVAQLLVAGIEVDARNSDDWTALMIASQKGHNEVVAQLLAAGAEVDARDSDDWTALMFASQNGHNEVVAQLLAAGAEVDARDGDDWIALMFASQNGHNEVVAQLLAAGAEVDARDNDDRTSLMFASQNGYNEVVAQLLAAGAEIDARDNNDWTSLMYASGHGHSAVVAQLLATGAEVASSSIGWTALMVASKYGYSDVVAKLLKANAEVNVKNTSGLLVWTALMYASQNGHSNVVAQLLAAKADVHIDNYYYGTSLMLASQNSKVKIISQLLEVGARINDTNNNGITALMFACKNGDVEVVSQLLAVGAEVCAVTNNGSTALMFASQNGYSEVITKLLSAGAKVDARDNNGWTALMCASQNGYNSVVAQLLVVKAEVDAKSKNRVTALIVASQNGHSLVVAQLLSAGAEVDAITKKGSTALMAASMNGYSDVVAQLLAADVDVDAMDYNCFTSLMLASRNGHSVVVSQLLVAKAEIGAASYGRTSLLLASQNGHSEVVAKLLAAGAELEVRGRSDWFGWSTALMFASENDHSEVVAQLLAAGAEVEGVNNKCSTALMVASKNGYSDVVAQLLAVNAELESKDSDGVTALMYASQNGHSEVVAQLLSADAELESKDSDGVTALMYASQNVHSEVVAQLGAAGADLDAISNDGATALMFASQNGHSEEMVVDQLVELGAMVDAKDNNGFTSLMFASQNGHGIVVYRLVDLGAVLEAKNNSGCTALMLASLKGHDHEVDWLIYLGAVLDVKDNNGSTALMLASQNGHGEVVTQLLDAGANAEIADNTGMTALTIASQNGHSEIVELLNQYMRK